MLSSIARFGGCNWLTAFLRLSDNDIRAINGSWNLSASGTFPRPRAGASGRNQFTFRGRSRQTLDEKAHLWRDRRRKVFIRRSPRRRELAAGANASVNKERGLQ